MSTKPPAGFHHVAFACRDVKATTRFYEDLMGFPLVHTEVAQHGHGYLRHVFYDIGDGSSIAFFDLHDVGEATDWRSDISTANGLPVWVNHVAFNADASKQQEVRARMAAADISPEMEIDHGWCRSMYFVDPNGILVELCVNTPGFEPNPTIAHAQLTAIPNSPKAT